MEAPALINRTIRERRGPLGLLIGSAVALGLIMRDRSVEGHRRDGLLGLVFLVGSGGTLIVGTRIVQEVQDIQTLLFGTAVAVLPEDLRALAVLTAIVVAVHLIGARGFVEVVFDPDGARVRGLPVGGIGAALLVTMAASVSLVTQVLGARPPSPSASCPRWPWCRWPPTSPGPC